MFTRFKLLFLSDSEHRLLSKEAGALLTPTPFTLHLPNNSRPLQVGVGGAPGRKWAVLLMSSNWRGRKKEKVGTFF